MASSRAKLAQRLGHRDAIHDWDHIPSRLVFEGADTRAPLASIAITTYRRPDLLVQAVRSALAQDFAHSFEIVIVDNDPASTEAEALVAAIPELRDANYRHFVAEQNLGVYGNFNRAILMSRSEWVTILNDDDLLDPDFLSLMFVELDRDPSIDAISSRKRYLDESRPAQPAAARPSPSLYRRARSLARMAKLRVGDEYLFAARPSRRIPPSKFFWGTILGNGAGFLFRRSAALAVGGFYPEENPSSDYWFYVRLAALYHLREHRREAATVRITGANLTTGSVMDQLRQGSRLQRIIAETVAPRWWSRFLPMIWACDRAGFKQHWNAEVSQSEMEAMLGTSLPPADPRRLYTIRRLLRAL